jgi:hypothetical protein
MFRAGPLRPAAAEGVGEVANPRVAVLSLGWPSTPVPGLGQSGLLAASLAVWASR